MKYFKILNISFFTLLMAVSQFASAQPTTTFRSLDPKFGNGADGDLVVNSVLSIDVMRAKVTDIIKGPILPGTWPHQYDITHNKAHGSWSAGSTIKVGDIILLHQSYQPSCTKYSDQMGTKPAHIFAWVSSVASGGGSMVVRTDIPFTDTQIPQSISANDQVQVIRMNSWNNLTFTANSGFTCSAWDGETGGILAFFVKGKLDLTASNITFNASEKGYFGDVRDDNVSANVTSMTSILGTGGGLDATGGGGTLTTYREPHSKTMYNGSYCLPKQYSPLGGFGTAMEKPYKMLLNPNEAGYGCQTNNPSFFNLASGGEGGNPGLRGAAAGGSGGHGGPNDNGDAGSFGLLGTAAEPGHSGGGGAGGRGGGVIFIYAFEYDYDKARTPNPVFIVNGGDAEIGDDGIGKGGDGGAGGDGASGSCNSSSDYKMPGDKGLQGQAGKGADGGGGGSGGLPGYIRFFSNMALHTQFDHTSVEILAGKRGYGGKGTEKGNQGADGNIGAPNIMGTTCQTCYDTEETITTECNCAKAFALIGDEHNGSPLVLVGTDMIHNPVYAADYNGGSQFAEYAPAHWNDYHKILTVRHSKITQVGDKSLNKNQKIETKKYYCVLNGLDPNTGELTGFRYNPFDNLVNELPNSSSWVGDFNPNGISTFGTAWDFENDDLPQLGFWRNAMNQRIAVANGCETIIAYDGKKGNGGKGRKPDLELPGDERDGEDYEEDFSGSNVSFSHGVSPTPPLSLNSAEKQVKLSLFPNPSSDHVSIKVSGIELNEVQSVNIYSLEGKLQKNLKFEREEDMIKFVDISHLKSGQYIVKLSIKDQIYAINFLKQ